MHFRRIKRELMEALCDTLKVTKWRVYQIIEERRGATKFLYSNQAVALDLAAERGIDIRKYASPEDLEEVRKLNQRYSTADVPSQTRPTTRARKASGGTSERSAFKTAKKRQEKKPSQGWSPPKIAFVVAYSVLILLLDWFVLPFVGLYVFAIIAAEIGLLVGIPKLLEWLQK